MHREVDVNVDVTPNRPGEPDRVTVVSMQELPTGERRVIATASVDIPSYPVKPAGRSSEAGLVDYGGEGEGEGENVRLAVDDGSKVVTMGGAEQPSDRRVVIEVGKSATACVRILQGSLLVLFLALLLYNVIPPQIEMVNGHKEYLPPGSKLGSTHLPFIGESLDWWCHPLNFTIDRVNYYGRVSYSDVMWQNTVILSGPVALKYFYNSSLITRNSGYPSSFQTLMGGNILPATDGERHRDRAEMMMRVLRTPRYVNAYVEVVNNITIKYMKRWNALGEFDWMNEFKLFSSEVAAAIFFAHGDKGRLFQQDFDHVLKAMNAMPITTKIFNYGKGIAARDNIYSWLEDEVDYHIHPEIRPTLWDALRLMTDFMANDPYHPHPESQIFSGTVPRKDLETDVYYGLLSTYAIYKQLTFMVVALSQNHDAFKVARAEALTFARREIDVDMLNEMPMVAHCINEVRRYYPTNPAVLGTVKQSFHIGEYYIPRGWTAMASLYTTNHDPEQYSEPGVFNPFRFSNGNKTEPVSGEKYAYVPQGAHGVPHHCSGEDLTVQIMRTVLVHLLSGATWDVAPDQRYDLLDTTMILPEPKQGFRVRNFRAGNARAYPADLYEVEQVAKQHETAYENLATQEPVALRPVVEHSHSTTPSHEPQQPVIEVIVEASAPVDVEIDIITPAQPEVVLVEEFPVIQADPFNAHSTETVIQPVEEDIHPAASPSP